MYLVHRNIKLISQCSLQNTTVCMMKRYLHKYSGSEQIEYLKSALKDNFDDWPVLKNNILCRLGTVNEKNVDAVILKMMVRTKQFDSALSFMNHLKSSHTDLSIGVTNSILSLYYEIAKIQSLSDPEKHFILSTYKNLYHKYKVLDYSTAEILLLALCAIDDWKKALKVLDDIQVSGTPSHIAYSTLVGTLFNNNKEKEAMEIIKQSVADLRPLQYIAYKQWIEYYQRGYKTKGIVLKHIHKICLHLSENCTVISKEAADEIKNTYISLGWKAEYAKIRKESAQCTSCSNTLKCLKLSNEEFEFLHRNIKDKLIVGSDLFLKTSPKELNAFMNFVDASGPCDIVLDALNIAYAMGKSTNIQKIDLLKSVVDHFSSNNKKVLLLGRKHMLKWHKKTVEYLMRKTCYFFTEDISQDDPFFITAAILSGPQTDIVSKDLLRGHRFILKDEGLKQIFQRWQWEHQWKVFLAGRRPIIQPPLRFTPCAQKNEDGWHLPYEKATDVEKGLVHDGVPNYDSWLCLRPKVVQ